MRKIILKNSLSPGDIVMLTAAVRDLHLSHPNQFLTDVRTPCGQLWENNPYITPLKEPCSDRRPGGQSQQKRPETGAATTPVANVVLDCEYPLIHRSNTEPWHFIHGFTQFLSAKLSVNIRPGPFKGDIHLAPQEKQWVSQVQEITKEPVPFWIIVAGGKRDFTIKWWSHERFQKVVDYFRGKILFVQVGEKNHEHQQLKGALDFRGMTDLRQLVRLVYHAQGVLCPVTLMMHLAAAVETKPGMPQNRPCVVVAGGREPSQWEAYPHHQYIHTNGALLCCDNGGCWKSRAVPLGDGDEKDNPDKMCEDLVLAGDGACSAAGGANAPAKNALAYPREEWPHLLPRCMNMITAEEVIRRIELYFTGGAVRYLTPQEVEVCHRTIPSLMGPPETAAVSAVVPKRKTAYLSYRSINLGDDMQSLALCKHLGQPDLFVDRDRFPSYATAGPIRLIVNGFFTASPFPPPPNIEPVYVALCVGKLKNSDPATVEHLRAAAPIGCRDKHSLRWCEKLGIDAYFASCPSILFDRTIPYDPTGPVVFVDVEPQSLPPFDGEVVVLTNRVRPDDFPSPEARFRALEERVLIYQRARLVVTNRLHVAMPCLGMDVPLIMVDPNSVGYRLTALPDFLRMHKKENLRNLSRNAEDHRHDATAWKRMVAERLHERLAKSRVRK
ncbi:MAG: hypothetical protein FJ395_07370 [Verrucomicrobia bacterium]|nr:hypothetical protein [Verrucomicrobiota bacterium]